MCLFRSEPEILIYLLAYFLIGPVLLAFDSNTGYPLPSPLCPRTLVLDVAP